MDDSRGFESVETEWKQRLMGYKQISNDQLLVIKPFTERPVKLALKIKGTKNKCAKCTIYSIFRYKVELWTNEKRATC